MKHSFDKIYKEIYNEVFGIIEKKREDIKTRVFDTMLSTVSIGLLIGLILAIINNNSTYILICIILALFISAILLRDTESNYNKEYKLIVIKKIFEKYKPNMQYRYNLGISSYDYRMGEFEKFDRYYSEDSIVGKLKNGATIRIAKVITKKTSNDPTEKDSIVFNGIFAKVDLNKKINSITKIRRNEIDKGDTLSMDVVEFERIFDVYSENKIETMQILTLDIMEKIIDLTKQKYVVPDITIKGNAIYLRVRRDGYFLETDLLKNPLDYRVLKRYFDIINFIEDISDEIVKHIDEIEI